MRGTERESESGRRTPGTEYKFVQCKYATSKFRQKQRIDSASWQADMPECERQR